MVVTGTSNVAELRRAAGHTQKSFVATFGREAELLGLDASVTVRQLRRWEREKPPPLPHPSQQSVLESLFGWSLVEMGFEVPVHRMTEACNVGHAEVVKRRTFAIDAGTVMVGAVLSRREGSRVGTADIDRLRSQLHRLYRTDHTAGSAPARARARQIEGRLTHTLSRGSYTARVGRSLQGMLSELRSLQAWFGYDGGPIEQARTASVEALTSAQLTGDPLLRISALDTLILLSIKADRVWEAASAVDYGYRLASTAGAGPAVRLVIALREANVATHTHDFTAARRALTRGISYAGRLDTDTDVPPWAAFAGEGEVDYATASMYVRAEQPRQAIPFLRAAVSRLGNGYGRNTAWYRSKLAGVLLRAGEVEEACAEMHAVLDTHGSITSARLVRRMQSFRQQAACYDTADARDCAARIRDITAGSAPS